MRKEFVHRNPALVYQYELDWINLKPIAEHHITVKEQHKLETNARTSFLFKEPHTHKLPELQPYFKWQKPIFTDYVYNVLGYPYKGELVVQNAWFTKYQPGGYIIEHNHRESVAVSCLYIELAENGGNIEFKDPFFDIKKDHSTNKQDNWLWNPLEVRQSDYVIFDAALPHRSQPNNSGKERWTLTTNIGFIDHRVTRISI